MNDPRLKRGITLLELVIVVVIFGLLAAIAIPKFSSGSPGDAEELLRRHLSVLRTAIEMYYNDHGAYPGQCGTGHPQSPAETEAAFILQLTERTDATGRVLDPTESGPTCGPYLRRGIPPCPVTPRRGKTAVHVVAGKRVPRFTPTATEAGWVYNCHTGAIVANSDGYGPSGTRYESY